MAVEIDKETFEVDRLGLMKIRRRYLTDSRAEALTGLPMIVDGLPLVGTRGQIWISKNDGRHVVDAAYEGLVGDPDESLDEYELITEDREQKIEAFRPRDRLIEDYGASYDEKTDSLIFPPTLPRPASRLGQPLTVATTRRDRQGFDASEAPNPLYGAKTYPVPHTTAILRMVRKKVPGSLTKQEGTIIDRLPAGFDYSGPKKQFYVRPLQKRRRGNSWSIEWTAFQVTDFSDLEVLLALRGKR
jgi:hypothetical protein